VSVASFPATTKPPVLPGHLLCMCVHCLQPVPCYLKIFNGFCFTSKDKEACTFYANPSYP